MPIENDTRLTATESTDNGAVIAQNQHLRDHEGSQPNPGSSQPLRHKLDDRTIHWLGGTALAFGSAAIGAAHEGPTYGDFARMVEKLPNRWVCETGVSARDYLAGIDETRNFQSAVELWSKGKGAWWLSPATPVAEERAMLQGMKCRGAIRGVCTAAGAAAAYYAVGTVASEVFGADSSVAQILKPNYFSIGLSTAGVLAAGGGDWRVKAGLAAVGWAGGKLINYVVDS